MKRNNIYIVFELILKLYGLLIAFFTPLLLGFSIICISGKIYKMDSTFDDGTALFIGIVLFLLWLLLCVGPEYYIIKSQKKYTFVQLIFFVLGIVWVLLN